MPFVPSISEEEVKAVQTAWANAIKTISKTYLAGGAGSGSFNRSMDTISDGLAFYGDHIREHKGILQRAWAGSFENKGSESLEVLIAWAIQGDYVAQAAKAAGELYGYGHTNVLFKPTKVGGKSNNAVH